MPLLKSSPTIRLLLTRELVAGTPQEIIVELRCRRAVPIERVIVTLLGDLVWTYAGGHYRGFHGTRFLEQSQVLLAEPREFDVGTHRLSAIVQLPRRTPGSWEGPHLRVEYRIRIDVGIPWWPDPRREFAVPVLAADAEINEDAPRVWASRPNGPAPRQPYLEVSLGTTTVHPGGELRGSAALGNVEEHRYRKLQISLIAREQLPKPPLGPAPFVEHRIGRWAIELDELAELAPIPFLLRMPSSLVPGFSLLDCRLRWVLGVSADVAWAADPELRIPIDVQPGSPLPASGQLHAAPLAVGSERMRLLWTAVAQASGLSFLDGRLRGRIDAIDLEVRRSPGLRGGSRLLGELRFPALGVALQRGSERRGPLLRARDAPQTQVIERQLGGLLREHPPHEVHDDRLIFERDGAGLDQAELQGFVDLLRQVAEALEQLPAQLPAPLVMQAHAELWARAAAGLGGSLRRADLRVELEREQARILIGCEFDDSGELRATRLELDPGLTIPSRLLLDWTSDEPLPEHPWPLAELTRLPRWAADLRAARVALHVGHRSVRVVLPAPLPDPRLERDRVELLLAIARELHGEQGPYR